MYRLAYFSIFLLFSFGLLQAEMRTFTNDFGDSVEAELIELKDNGTIVTMRLKNGRTIDARISAFSQDDKKYIRDWWKEEEAGMQVLNKKARVSLEVEVRTKTDKSGSGSYYYNRDRMVKMFLPEVTVDNVESQTFKGNEVRIVFFAEDIRSKSEMLIVSAKTIKTDFKERKKTNLKIEAFRLRTYEYESYYSNYEYKRGYKYTGYAIKIKNSAGEVTHEEATKEEFLNPDFFFTCKEGEVYDGKFEHKLSSRSSSSSSSSSGSSSNYYY